MLGNLRYIPKNYRLGYKAYLFALMGNLIYMLWQQPSWLFSIVSIIVLFAVDCFFFSKSTQRIIWPLVGDIFFYILFLLLIFQ